MGIRLNVFCNGQIAVSDKYRDGFDNMHWPDAPKRDEFGIIIKDEERDNADLSE